MDLVELATTTDFGDFEDTTGLEVVFDENETEERQVITNATTEPLLMDSSWAAESIATSASISEINNESKQLTTQMMTDSMLVETGGALEDFTEPDSSVALQTVSSLNVSYGFTFYYFLSSKSRW